MLAHQARSLAARLAVGARLLSTFTTLPVINIAPLINPRASEKEKVEVGKQLHDACREIGFFYVVNHGMPAGVQQGVLAQARQWFSLPETIKQQVALSPATHYRGWQRLGANVTRYEGGFQRDWHEALDYYKEIEPSELQAGDLQPSPIHGINPWPEQIPEFAAVLRQYIAGCLDIGAAIMRGIALGLQLPEDFFEGERAGDSYWVTRVIHYPPLRQGSQYEATGQRATQAVGGAEVERSTQLSCGEHTDYGLLTLVNQESHMAALQVKNAEGQWVTATPVPGSFVVNTGDMLKVWSNGLYIPTLHRVVNSDPLQSRVSIPFFYEPNYEAWVAPPEQLCRGRPRLFEPVRYGNHLLSKVTSNFEL